MDWENIHSRLFEHSPQQPAARKHLFVHALLLIKSQNVTA